MKDLKSKFDEIVKDHKVEIIKDDGLYRHISATNNGSCFYRFDLITWPGYLAYAGDMGSFVFARIPDMFSFFRGEEINPSYWAEKVFAESIHDGVEKFSVDLFRESVLRDTRGWIGLDDEDEIPQKYMNAIEPLLSAEDEYTCVERMRDFWDEEIRFTDFFEHDLKDFTDAFLLACYAIVWAIGQYDDLKGVEK